MRKPYDVNSRLIDVYFNIIYQNATRFLAKNTSVRSAHNSVTAHVLRTLHSLLLDTLREIHLLLLL